MILLYLKLVNMKNELSEKAKKLKLNHCCLPKKQQRREVWEDSYIRVVRVRCFDEKNEAVKGVNLRSNVNSVLGVLMTCVV